MELEPLSAFLFQCFLLDFVWMVGTTLALDLGRGLSVRRLSISGLVDERRCGNRRHVDETDALVV